VKINVRRNQHRLNMVTITAARNANDLLLHTAKLLEEQDQLATQVGSFSHAQLQHRLNVAIKTEQVLSAARYCMDREQRAQKKIEQHRQLVAVCNTTHAEHTTGMRETLSQVAARHALLGKARPCATENRSGSLSPIATCAASNAPSQDLAAHTQGVSATT